MIAEKIKNLEKDQHAYIRKGKADEYHCKLAYLNAKKNNTLTEFRATEIAKRVAKMYSLDKQIEILLNGDVGEIALLKAHRVQIATEVDNLITQLESELNSN